jgi:hypothetical protein
MQCGFDFLSKLVKGAIQLGLTAQLKDVFDEDVHGVRKYLTLPAQTAIDQPIALLAVHA